MNTWWCSRYWYIPIAIIIILGYSIGGFLWFSYGFEIDNKSQDSFDYFVTLFSLGIIGGAMRSDVFFRADMNDKIFTEKRLPTVFDLLGYTCTIVCSGFTGVFLYLAFKAGIIVVLSGSSTIELSKYAAWLIAFSGGFSANSVKQLLFKFVSNTANDKVKDENSESYQNDICGNEERRFKSD